VICVFAQSDGAYTYITTNKVAQKFWTHDGVKVTWLKSGHARLDFTIVKPSARLVFFGVS
jgi:hypothetical protein